MSTTAETGGREVAPASSTNTRLIEQIMPAWDVRERHEIMVNAPAAFVFDSAQRVKLRDSPLVRGIMFARTLPSLLSRRAVERPLDRSLLEETLSLGWQAIGSHPGREIVMAAVTEPWKGTVTFHGMPRDAFLAFDQPGYAKIVWSLESIGLEPAAAVFLTETRVLLTSEDARRRFRRYWRLVVPGVVLIRREMLRLVRRDAERRWKYSRPLR